MFMTEPMKIKKILAVVFLTVLIWVWSDLALDDTDDLTQIPIEMGGSSDPALLVSFVDDVGQLTERITINTVKLKGPAVRIGEIKRLERSNLLELHLALSPDQEGFIEPGETTTRLTSIVKENPVIRGLGLSVESCVPSTASIRIMRLTRKLLPVRCRDETGTMIPDGQVMVTPATVNMHVPEECLAAYVTLSEDDLNRARGDTPIDKIPFVDIDGRKKVAKQSVEVRLSEQAPQLERQLIAGPKFCLVVDPVIQQEYEVRISNVQDTVLSSIYFKGTDEAKRAYQNEPYHVELVVDNRKPGQQAKFLQYRFPREFVEKNQIKPWDRPLNKIDFELVPRKTSSAAVTPP